MRFVLGSNARVAKFAAQVSVASREHDDFCANWAVILEERGTRSSLQGQVPFRYR
jgi:sister-chromatid-cohesion protein PDS5